MKDLAGKTAVVAGGADGIGRGLVLVCAQKGMNVVVADIQADLGARTAGEAEAFGVKARFVKTNVADLASMEALANSVYDEFGATHLLCNNAGVVEVGWSADASLEDWQWMLDVNYWGVVNSLIAFLPRMRQQAGEKHIMNTGSTASYVPVAGFGPYNAAKFAVAGLTETLRIELARDGIGVTMFCPADTDTNLAENSVRIRGMVLGSAPRELPAELRAALMDRRTDLDEPSMDPVEVARIAIERGVEEDRALVFTHPTPRRLETTQQRFDNIIAAYPRRPSTA